MSDPFIAEVRIWGLNFAPRGWAFCDGQLLPIAQNTALFSLIGTTYGGDGRTTTGLPDLQNRMPMGPGRGPGLTSRSLGEKVGSATQTLTVAQIPPHSHTAKANSARANLPDPSNEELAGGHNIYNTTAGTDRTGPAVANQGNSQAHDNASPFLGLTFTIALVGIYPSRS
jgi:microcystin-dependent protein